MIKLEVIQAVTEKDGTITAYIEFKSIDGIKLHQICVQGPTVKEVKNNIKMRLKEFKEKNAGRISLKNQIKTALLEVEAEEK